MDMNKEELKKHIHDMHDEKCASHTYPFKTPEGYFDTFCDRLMLNLPEENTKKAPTVKLMPRVVRYAAACAAIAIIIGGTTVALKRQNTILSSGEQQTLLSFNSQDTSKHHPAAPVDQQHNDAVSSTNTQNYDEAYLNEVLDYAMVDNNEIAMYLTEN